MSMCRHLRPGGSGHTCACERGHRGDHLTGPEVTGLGEPVSWSNQACYTCLKWGRTAAPPGKGAPPGWKWCLFQSGHVHGLVEESCPGYQANPRATIFNC